MIIPSYSKTWRSVAIALLLTFTLSACATNAGHRQLLQSFIGKTESDLIASWGTPANAYTLKDGSKSLVFTTDQGTVYCSTTFILDPAGVVASATYIGNNCVASYDY